MKWISPGGKYVKRVKTVTENGDHVSKSGAGAHIFAYQFGDCLTADVKYHTPYCDCYKYVPTYDAANMPNYYFQLSTTVGTWNAMRFRDNRFSTVEEAKAYLSQNPFTLQYILATPVETDLSEEELAAYAALHTYKPNTTIYNDAGAWMDVGYYTPNATMLQADIAKALDTAKAEANTYTDSSVRKAVPRNLLDNSNFRNPVNQRGKTSYTTYGYTIDRWLMWIESGKGSLTVNDGYISVSFENHGTVVQYIEKGVLDPSKKYTRAIKNHDGDIELLSPMTVFYGKDKDSLYLCDLRNGVVQDIEWIAVYEGEYTAETLPEYRPKRYGAELAECQRYYQIRSANNIAAVDMRPTMRLSSPTITSVTGGYAYSADL